MTAGQSLDGNYKPLSPNLYDPVGNQFVPGEAGAVTTANGQPYAPSVSQQASAHKVIAAGSGAAAVVVKATPGVLVTVTCTGATSTADLIFYDNASAGSGDILGIIASGATKGTTTTFNMPAVNGITAEQASGSAAVTVAYS